MSIFRRLFASRPSGPPEDPQDLARRLGVPAPDRRRKLVLYKFDSCPYCRRVLRTLDELAVEVDLRDTLQDRHHGTALFELTGRTQVPCLVIDGTPLFESSDIVDWLRSYAAHARAA
ncbi:MAG: glutaredoxin [Deltaproteobacteria bacterium]|nr:MAG: glutaredoxin [Deltaproteobacteria bacterium]